MARVPDATVAFDLQSGSEVQPSGRAVANDGGRMARTPACAPNCNVYAERFVRLIKEECLNRIVPLGEPYLAKSARAVQAHYHGEQNHRGLGNGLIDRPPAQRTRGPVRRRQRMGGILSHYCRSAA